MQDARCKEQDARCKMLGKYAPNGITHNSTAPLKALKQDLKQGNEVQLRQSALNEAYSAMHTKCNNSCGDATAAAVPVKNTRQTQNHTHQSLLIRIDGAGNLRDTSCKGCFNHTTTAKVDDGLAQVQQLLQRREGRRVSNECWVCVAHSWHPHVKEERHAPVCMHANTCWSELFPSMSRVVSV